MRRREVPGGVRFVTFSCQYRLPPFTNARIAQLFINALARVRAQHALRVLAWVVMPEHVHILCLPPEGISLELLLRRMKMSVAKRVIERWKMLNAPILDQVADATGRPRFWQKGGGLDRNIRHRAELSRFVRYIHRNPVDRGLVARAEDWPWSSVRWWMGVHDGPLECDSPPGPPGSWDGWKGFA